MSLVISHKAVKAVSESKDPKSTILNFVGDLNDFEVFGDYVLIGTYIRPEKTKGGIIRPDENKQEDVWQGKAGLVLKLGPDAFMDKDGHLYEQAVNPGDWCVFFVGDGKSVQIREFPCRLVRDVNIRLKIKDPETII